METGVKEDESVNIKEFGEGEEEKRADENWKKLVRNECNIKRNSITKRGDESTDEKKNEFGGYEKRR